VFEGRVIEVGFNGTWLDWNGHRILARVQAKVGARIEFLIRQEQLHLQAAITGTINQVCGQVDHVRRRGKSQVVSVGVGNPKRLQVQCSVNERVVPGEEVAVSFLPDAVWIFPIISGTPADGPGGSQRRVSGCID
jgi:ABC-type sugar transport system ATPase subunit